MQLTLPIYSHLIRSECFLTPFQNTFNFRYSKKQLPITAKHTIRELNALSSCQLLHTASLRLTKRKQLGFYVHKLLQSNICLEHFKMQNSIRILLRAKHIKTGFPSLTEVPSAGNPSYTGQTPFRTKGNRKRTEKMMI